MPGGSKCEPSDIAADLAAVGIVVEDGDLADIVVSLGRLAAAVERVRRLTGLDAVVPGSSAGVDAIDANDQPPAAGDATGAPRSGR